jgi:hypothetical protein
MYACHNVLKILTEMSTFRMVVFWDIPLVNRFEVFKPVTQRNNNALETTDFAVSTFLI